jgi:hypothetical protein
MQLIRAWPLWLAVAATFAVVAFAAAAFSAPASARERIDSAYTKHDYEKCKVVEDDDPVKVTQCEGLAGIPVKWTNEPDSSIVEFGSDGVVPDDAFAKRFTFSVAPETIEWRGVMKAGKFVPFATIARFSMCGGIGGPCHGELIVFRLDGKKRSCMAASVDARIANANERARELADTVARRFNCDKDKTRPVEE